MQSFTHLSYSSCNIQLIHAIFTSAYDNVGVFPRVPVKLIDRGCCCWQSWPLLRLRRLQLASYTSKKVLL